MPDRYWVGTGNWDSSNTANWRTTSGGTTTAAVPTNADDVYFDANSTAGTCTIVGNRPCQNINFRGPSGSSNYTGTFTLPTGTTVSIGGAANAGGSITLSPAMTFGAGSIGTFSNASSTATFTSNGKTFPGNISIAGPGGSLVNFADNWTIQGTFTGNTVAQKNIRSSVSGTLRTITVEGGLNGGGNLTGTVADILLKMTGTGILSGYFTNCSIEIASPAGTITQNSLRIGGCPFTYTQGNYISTAGVSTEGTLTSFNNVSGINFHSLFGIGGGGQTITLNSNMNIVNGISTVGGTANYTINGPLYTLFVGGNITGQGPAGYGFLGTASIQMNGSTSALINRSTTGSYSIENNLSINKSGVATVTLDSTLTALSWGITGRTLTAASSAQFNPGTTTVGTPNNSNVSISENISFYNFSPGTTTTINII
jgi:hypothetical protein